MAQVYTGTVDAETVSPYAFKLAADKVRSGGAAAADSATVQSYLKEVCEALSIPRTSLTSRVHACETARAGRVALPVSCTTFTRACTCGIEIAIGGAVLRGGGR